MMAQQIGKKKLETHTTAVPLRALTNQLLYMDVDQPPKPLWPLNPFHLNQTDSCERSYSTIQTQIFLCCPFSIYKAMHKVIGIILIFLRVSTFMYDDLSLILFPIATNSIDLNENPRSFLVLVALVKACETRDLLPVVECIYQRNQIRKGIMFQGVNNNSLNASFESAGSAAFSLGVSTEASSSLVSIELDCYRTVLYLARYQCTTAFHAFFPTTIRACKGYHFWCAIAPTSTHTLN